MEELDGAVAELETGAETGAEDSALLGELDTPEGGAASEVDDSEAAAGAENTEEQVAAAEEPEPGLEKLPPQYHKDKFVKALYHANQKLRESYPGGVSEAIKIKQDLDRIGGVDGLASIEAQRGEWENTDRGLAEGNPAVLDKLASQSPEGFVKLMGPALDKLQQVDQDAYNHSLGKIFWNTLAQHRVVDDLSTLEAALGRKDFDSATQQLAKVGEFLRTINGLASNVPKKTIDPAIEKFQKEKSAWEQQRQKEFQDGVLSETRQYALGKIESQLSKEFSTRGLSLVKLKTEDSESYDILIRNCYQAVNSKLAEDKDSTKRFATALGSGKRDDALKLARSRVDASFADVVGRTYKAFYRVAGGKTQPQATKTPAATAGAPKAATGAIALSKIPEPQALDKIRMYNQFGKDKTDSLIYQGRGYLKGKPGLYDWTNAR